MDTNNTFSKEYPTWIIAFCPDTAFWFCSNQRQFFYEYPKTFNTENEAIKFFEEDINKFFQ